MLRSRAQCDNERLSSRGGGQEWHRDGGSRPAQKGADANARCHARPRDSKKAGRHEGEGSRKETGRRGERWPAVRNAQLAGANGPTNQDTKIRSNTGAKDPDNRQGRTKTAKNGLPKNIWIHSCNTEGKRFLRERWVLMAID